MLVSVIQVIKAMVMNNKSSIIVNPNFGTGTDGSIYRSSPTAESISAPPLGGLTVLDAASSTTAQALAASSHGLEQCERVSLTDRFYYISSVCSPR